MEENLLELKRNIISWYPIEKEDFVLQIGADEEILKELKEKSNNVTSLDDIHNIEAKPEYDYVTLIGSFEKLKSEQEIIDLLKFAKNSLKTDGKILLAMQNKFGMKYWSGEKVNQMSKQFESIVRSNGNIFSFTKIKSILNNLNLKYKFYYPLPDYKTTNVIYTDEFMPTKENIDSRIVMVGEDGELLNFSQTDAYKQLINEDETLFPFFSNSFFIEISNIENFEDIKFVSFSIIRKKEYRIRTIIRTDKVYKYADNPDSIEHIKKILDNIKILKKCNIEVLEDCNNGVIQSNYLNESISFDSLLMKIYYEKGLEKTIEKIKEFYEKIWSKLLIDNFEFDKTVFDKYEIELPLAIKEKLHFTPYGILDLIFQNCLVKDDKLYIYDQEWFEENVPVEFILYRSILYFTELRTKEDVNHLYKILKLDEFVEYFKILDDKIQEKIKDEDTWNSHIEAVNNIGSLIKINGELKEVIKEKEEENNNLNEVIKEKEEKNHNLNEDIKEKDRIITDLENQLKNIGESLSWKFTKPMRDISEMFNNKK